jgi:hypothetical protein
MGKLAIEHVQVCAAYPASRDLDEDLVRSGRSHRQLGRSERHVRAVEHHRLHHVWRHYQISFLSGTSVSSREEE